MPKKLFIMRNSSPPQRRGAILPFHPGLIGTGEDCLRNDSVKAPLCRCGVGMQSV